VSVLLLFIFTDLKTVIFVGKARKAALGKIKNVLMLVIIVLIRGLEL